MIDEQYPKTIYLVPTDLDGPVWETEPAPGEGMDPDDAVRYVRADSVAQPAVSDDKMREAVEGLERMALHCNSATGDARDQFQRDYAAIRRALQSQHSENLVPGVMRCAKCNFQLIRNNLNANAGTVTAGDSKTEPCPNGCGPLWPVTWKQRAHEFEDTAERFFEELQALKSQQPESEPMCYLKWRSVLVAPDDAIEGFEEAKPGERSDDGTPAFPVFASHQPSPQVPEGWRIEHTGKYSRILIYPHARGDMPIEISPGSGVAGDEMAYNYLYKLCEDLLTAPSIAPTTPQVPGRMTSRRAQEVMEPYSIDLDLATCGVFSMGWNECRKAMLTAAPSIAEEREPDQPDLPLADGYVLLPRELTAENGAKAALIGEFEEAAETHCGYCDGEAEGDDCEMCGGSGIYTFRLPVQWTTIKDIWRAAVQHFDLHRPAPPAGGE